MADVQLRPDIQAARDRMSHRLGSNREINKAEIGQMQKPDGKAVVDAINSIISKGPVHAQAEPAHHAPPVQHAPSAPMSSFEMVKELRNRGVLTPDEFGQIVNGL
ncbi:hypothetical protein HFP72_06775 [Nocardiopsis sp. ARC36]